VELQLNAFLTSALGGVWWASCPGLFAPGKGVLFLFDGGLGGPRSRPGGGDDDL